MSRTAPQPLHHRGGARIRAWLARYLARARGYPQPSRRDLEGLRLVIGVGRSGTTILKNALAVRTDAVEFPGEANDLWFGPLYPWRDDLDVEPVWRDPEVFHAAARQAAPGAPEECAAVLGQYHRLWGRRTVLYKAVNLGPRLDDLHLALGAPRAIHILRDGRDVALSMARKERPKLEGSPLASLTEEQLVNAMARYWARNARLLTDFAERNKEHVLTIRYGELLNRPRETLEVCANHLRLVSRSEATDRTVTARIASGRTLGERDARLRAVAQHAAEDELRELGFI